MKHQLLLARWDAKAEGYRIHCSCGYSTRPTAYMEYAGLQFDEHVKEELAKS